MPRISVLLPVYNVEAYVAEAVASIQAQSFSEIEIVIVDDGSTDGTLGIVKQMAEADPRIRIVRAPEHMGLPLALNFGLSFCRAPFIARMDGDDVALPLRLEKQLHLLEAEPEIALVGCETSAIDESGAPIPGLGVSRKPVTREAVEETALLAPPCSHIWLARREVYDALEGYREITVAEDYDFLLRALSAGFHITNLPESLMLIRARAGNNSWRLEQRKSHDYIVGLYRERMQSGRDSFSPEGYEQAVRAGKMEDSLFRLATRCVQKGLKSRGRLPRYFLLALSALISPWQARYFLIRLRLKRRLRALEDCTAASGA
jgi:glycosyltransferase involved in cell wall biosynthesis